MIIRSRTRQSTPLTVNGRVIPTSQWEEPAYDGQISQDATALVSLPNCDWVDGASIVRVVVADGVTPVEGKTPSIDNLDGAAFAAQLVTRACTQAVPLPRAIRQTNDIIEQQLQSMHLAHQLTRRQRPQTMVRAVDVVIQSNGQWYLELLNAGDCRSLVWHANTDQNAAHWIDPIAESGYHPTQMQQWREYRKQYPDHTLQQTQEAEDIFFATPDHFTSTPIGAFIADELKYSTASYVPPLEARLDSLGLLVLSDGMREEGHPEFQGYDTVCSFLESLANQSIPRSPHDTSVKKRDDIAVISVGQKAPPLGPRPGRQYQSSDSLVIE